MHCHTQEGSVDASVSIEAYIECLKKQGFHGMLVTDHDSYKGYNYYYNTLRHKIKDFVVFKGIEYDTLDAGHMIIIMPRATHLKLLEHRGLPLRVLVPIVHKYGGVIGPAHPCGERFLSIYSTGRYKKDRTITESFDFMEGFNACEAAEVNAKAANIAKRYGKLMTGGSDAHKLDCIGLAYTEIDENLKNEDELIAYIKAHKPMRCGGERYMGTVKEHMGKLNKLLVYGFFPYNKAEALLHHRKRRYELKGIFHELLNDLEQRREDRERKVSDES